MNVQTRKRNAYKNNKVVEKYIEQFPPNENRPSIGIDLVALTRYATSVGKKTNELTEEEIEAFRTRKE